MYVYIYIVRIAGHLRLVRRRARVLIPEGREVFPPFHVCIHLCIHLSIYLSSIYLSIYLYIYVHICMYEYVYIYIYI